MGARPRTAGRRADAEVRQAPPLLEALKRYEIRRASLDPTRGAEMAKTRPVVIVSLDVLNERLQTIFPNIYAAGDVAGPYQFTHVAAHQAWYAAVNGLFGRFALIAANASRHQRSRSAGSASGPSSMPIR